MLAIICAFSFNNKAIFILSTSCVYVFWVILTLNNKSFLQQEKKSIFFVEEAMCAFCETGFKFINIRLIKDTFLSVLSHFHFLFVSLSLPAFCNKLLTLNFDLEWADFFWHHTVNIRRSVFPPLYSFLCSALKHHRM